MLARMLNIVEQNYPNVYNVFIHGFFNDKWLIILERLARYYTFIAQLRLRVNLHHCVICYNRFEL